MADCELLTKCPFFNDQLKNMSAASDMMKKIYCRWNFAKCARYRVAIALGRKKFHLTYFLGILAELMRFLFKITKSNQDIFKEGKVHDFI